MVQVIWTEDFRNDLHEITFYLNRKSAQAALQFAEKIDSKLKLLETFPELGRMIPERRDHTIRDLIVDRYRIIYEIVSDDRIYISKIHHSSRKNFSLE